MRKDFGTIILGMVLFAGALVLAVPFVLWSGFVFIIGAFHEIGSSFLKWCKECDETKPSRVESGRDD